MLQRAVVSCACILPLLLTGCGLFASRNGMSSGDYLPLTVQLRQASTVAAAQIAYSDACGKPQSFPIGEALSEAIKRKTGKVFQKVVTDQSESVQVDGYQDVSVGMTDLDLIIHRKANRSFPATLAIGLDVVYTAADGTVLFSKKIQGVGRGDVDVTESSCDVKGIEKVTQEAIDIVTDGMAKQLGASGKIAEAAKIRQVRGPVAAGSVPLSPFAGESAPTPINTPPASPPIAETAGPVPSDEQATLVFRAIIRDQNRNQLLHAGEIFSIEIEVKNEGPGPAAAVEIVVSGTAALVEQIPSVLPMGDLPAGEVKRVSLEGKIGMVTEALQAELLLALRSKSLAARLPSAKKFLIAMKPAEAAEAAMVPVDVDELPNISGKLKQPKAVGIAVGVGQFRESDIPQVKYAVRDADTMVKYWSVVGGIPTDRIRRFVDSQALKSDLSEAFEDWLPKQVDPTSVVYVFISGRGIAERATGDVSVIPFDGTTTSGTRVYPLRRLQEALVKLPILRAIIVLDLSLEQAHGKETAEAEVVPVWPQEGLEKDKIMWMIGSRSIQESHQFDPGQHGLFTYQLLRGFAGAADIDKDGTILSGELCTFARGRVIAAAREQFGNEQEPLCLPGPGKGATVRLQPVAKLK